MFVQYIELALVLSAARHCTLCDGELFSLLFSYFVIFTS